MSEPNPEDSTLDESYDEWLEACDEAIAQGRWPLDSSALQEPPDPADETLDLLRRLDGLRDRNAAAGDRPDDPGAGSADTEVAPGSLGQAPALGIGDPTEPERPRDDVPAPDELPRWFGDYELVELIAAGGMGIVYKARQQSLKRVVAVKMIRLGLLAGTSDLRRFQLEAEAAAKLDHPHIIPIYEVGTLGELPFFSMKLMDGGSLESLVGRSADDPRAAAGLLVSVAEAVHHAHQHGILHRDLKPANVLLDAEGRPYVSDFGLARSLEGESSLTQSGTILGTPSFIAPEQATGGRAKATTAADVYSLGAILYTMITGRPPFQAATPLETLRRVIDEEPPAPRVLNPKVDRDLEAICLKCLRKDPRDRYSSAHALADDLRRYLDGRSIQVRRTTAAERAWRWSRRNRAVAGMTVAFLLALLSGLVGVTTQWIRAEDHAAKEVKARRAAENAQEQTRRYLYVARMNLAQQASETAQTRRLLEVLNPYRPGTDQAHLRGFEWYYWWRTCHLYRSSLVGHAGTVYSVAFDPRSGALASGGADGQVQIWDPATGQLRFTLPGDGDEVQSLAFSPDGRVLASGSGEKNSNIRIWDFGTGALRATLKVNAGDVTTLAFSPTGAILAAALGNRTIQLWDVATGQPRTTLQGDAGLVPAVAFSPDGNVLASSSEDFTIKFWDLATGALRSTLKGHTDLVYSVAFSPDGATLASGGDDLDVRLWNVATGRPKAKLSGHTNNIRVVQFSPDGTTLASAGDDGTVRLWDLVTGTAKATLKGHINTVQSLAFSPDGATLASSGYDGTIKLWTLATIQPESSLSGHKDAIFTVAISPDDSTLASASLDGMIKLWDLANGRLRTTLESGARKIRCVVFSPDGAILASAHADGAVRLWDRATGQPGSTLKGHASAILALAFSPDGATLASVSYDKTVKLWARATGALKATLLAPGSVAAAEPLVDFSLYGAAVAFSPDGATLASSNTDRLVTLWDLATGKPRTTLQGQARMPFALAFSPDGTTLASAGSGQDVELWDTATGKHQNTLKAHLAWVRSVAFSPDGTTLASASDDRTVVLWDVLTGEPKTVLGGQKSYVLSLAFSRNGTTLACGTRGETVSLWRAATAEEVLTQIK